MGGWILKLILLYLVIRAVMRIVRGVLDGLRAPADPPVAVGLVRDPICGTFVVPSSALMLGTGSDTRFFCSEKCLRDYQVKFEP
jgi:YHS domain-containing protein